MNVKRYKHVTIDGKTRPEHCVVWEAANGPIPEGYVVHHIDGNGRNNDLSNLTIMTRGDHVRMHAMNRLKGEDVVDPTDPAVIEDRQQQAEYYRTHREAILARKQKWRKLHPDSERPGKLRYRQDHPDKIKEYTARHYKEHREEQIARSAEYRRNNPDKVRETLAKSRLKRKDAIRQYDLEHRAIKNARRNLNSAIRRGLCGDELTPYETRLREAVEEFKHAH